MQKFKMIYLLFLCVFMMGIASTADAVDLTLGASSTTVPPKSTFEIQVNVSEASTLCGAAVTVEYDATKVELVTTATTPAVIPAGSVDPAEITSDIFTLVTDSRTPPGTPAQAVPMAGNHQTAKVSLSGAYVDPATGAGKYTGSKKLFGLKFKLKDTVAKGDTISFNLKQTEIYNPAAGWGDATDTNKTPVPVPALVGVPAGWKDLPIAQQFKNIDYVLQTTPLVVKISDIISQKVGMPLKGWNLVSISVTPPSTAIADVLASIAGKYKVVWTKIGSQWLYYDPLDPDFSDLKTFEPNRGYWIETTDVAELEISGSEAAKSINLVTGWNLIGYPGVTKPTAEALASISGKYKVIWSKIGGQWKYFDPTDPDFSDLKEMIPGSGYWIEMTQAGTLNF